MSSSIYLFTSQALNPFLVIASSVLGSVLGAAEIQTLGKVSSLEDLAQNKEFEFHSIIRSEKLNKSTTLLRFIIEQNSLRSIIEQSHSKRYPPNWRDRQVDTEYHSLVGQTSTSRNVHGNQCQGRRTYPVNKL